MNKEFIKKIIKSEMLRYEAIKEILPENLKGRVENFEKEAASFMKDLALEMLSENICTKGSSSASDQNKKSTKKVQVDFT